MDLGDGIGPRLEIIAARHADDLSNLKRMVAGGTASCIAKVATSPLSRTTILMQVQSRQAKLANRANQVCGQGMIACMRTVYKEEGFLAFWRGTGATCVHRFPYGAISFYSNAKIKLYFERASWSKNLSEHTARLVAGCGSATIAVACCYPLDVIKTRITAQQDSRYYSSVRHAARKILQDEGIRGWYRGIGPTILSVVPGMGLSFFLFDEFSALFPGSVLISGASAGVVASTVVFPLDLVRRQMQMDGFAGEAQQYPSVVHAVRHVYNVGWCRYEGLPFRGLLACRELFRGLAPEMVKVTPSTAIMFYMNDYFLGCKWPFER